MVTSVSCLGTSDEQRRVLADLRELIVALDKRVPQLHQAGEQQIAVDAALLKERAEARIAALESALAGSAPRRTGSRPGAGRAARRR